MKITQKTKRLLLANTVVAVIVGVLAMHYLAPSQLAKADPINSTDFVMTIDTRKGVGNTFTYQHLVAAIITTFHAVTA